MNKNSGLFAHELGTTGSTLGDGVAVSIGGDKAYTDHKTIVIPGFDMNGEVSEETQRAMRGYVDHEAGHCRYTPEDLMQRAHDKGGMPLKEMTNAIEDLREERLVMQDFPGAKKNLEAVVNVTAREAANAMEAGGNVDMRDVGYGLTLLGRLRAGYDCPEAQRAYDCLTDETKEACERWVDEAMSCETADEVLDVAERVLADTWPGDDDDKEEDEQGKWEAKQAVAVPEVEGDDGSAYVPDKRWDKHFVLERQEDFLLLPDDHHLSHTADFSRGWEGKVPDCVDRAKWGKIKRKLRNMVGPMLGRVQAALMTETESVWQGGYTSGRLDSRRLVAAVAGQETVWRRKTGGMDLDTAVLLLVDCSGSMKEDHKIEQAAETAIVLSAVCDRANVPNAVVGFDSLNFERAAALRGSYRDWDEDRHDFRGQRDPAYTYQFKGFDTPSERSWFGLTSLSRMAFAENADADAIISAEAMLRRRQERRKVLIVLSDGMPASNRDGRLHDATKAAVKRLEMDPAFSVFGIGLQDSSVSNYYRDYAVLKDLAELPRTVTGELCKALIGRNVVARKAA